MEQEIILKNEVTNSVLAEQINGLAKLTDERFSMIKEALGRIEQYNLGFATKKEVEDVKKDFNEAIKRIEDGMHQHNLDDKDSFGGLDKRQRELRDTIKTWGGILTVITIFLPIIVPLILHYVFKIS